MTRNELLRSISRELLFRAWDEKNKRWYVSCNGMQFVDFSVFGECTMLCTPSPSDLCNIVLTQWVGRKDKNGKNIYEGDFVKEKSGDIFLIRWHTISNSFATFKLDSQGNFVPYFGYQTEIEKMEIVGNCFENIELLDIPIEEENVDTIDNAIQQIKSCIDQANEDIVKAGKLFNMLSIIQELGKIEAFQKCLEMLEKSKKVTNEQ